MLKNSLKKVVISAMFVGAFANFVFARESNQSHQKSVSVISSIVTSRGDFSVFSAGEDGFVIKWLEDDLGEHYQVSEFSIKKIAQHPNGNEVAVYETDNASFHRVSIWDWKNKKCIKKFSFKEPITNLSYSAKGKYLICGTTSLNGATFIKSYDKNIEKKSFKTSLGSFSFSQTGETEKKLVVYNPTGTFSYFDLQTGELFKKNNLDSGLTNVCTFKNSLFIAGVKGREVSVYHSITGEKLGTYNANAPVIIGSNDSESLFYISNENRQFKLYEIKSEHGKTLLQPELVRTFSGLKSNDLIVSASISGDEIYAGTKSGNVYKFDYAAAERVDVLQPITDDRFDKVLDISPCGNDFYILSPNAIHQSNYAEVDISRKCSNPGYTNMISYGEDVILWSKDTKKPVIKMNVSGDVQTTLFTPTGILQMLKLSGDKLIFVESNSFVSEYDILSGKKRTLYEGSSIQDAILCNESDLYIAKSNATAPNVPLLYVNIATQETVPLSLSGTFAYALNFDAENPKNEIYGIVASPNKTSVFAFDINKKASRELSSVNIEDIDAFMTMKEKTLYTNLGKDNSYSLTPFSSSKMNYNRSESMPLKIVRNKGTVIVLNRNGSISWYKVNSQNPSSNWYLNEDGEWFSL